MTASTGALARVGLIGAATGLRSTWGLAALSWAPHSLSGTAPHLARPWVRVITLAGAASEFVADKSPSTPSRLSPAGLAPRLLFGALTGAVLSGDRARNGFPVADVAAGTAASLVAALAGERWRTAGRRGVGSDPAAAAAEDAVAAALAATACAWAIRERRRAGEETAPDEGAVL
ncbi:MULTISPECIES: hypothetical protein [unclassified Streptomyces]|uniref:hypothetical protein n=1 Tax=unclassified Streptomyces TaxID=2593676 RepID=UPI0035DAA46A